MMKNQEGAALPMVLGIVTLLFIVVAALMPLLTNEVRFSSIDTNTVIMHYAAEAAVKNAMKEIQAMLCTPGTIDFSKIPKKTVSGIKISDSSPVTLSYEYGYGTDASNQPRFTIKGTGNYGSLTDIVYANVYLRVSPVKVYPEGVVDLINTGFYSHTDHNPNSGINKEARWGIDKTVQPNTADPNIPGLDASQIMFSAASEKDNLDIAYRAIATYMTGKNSNGGGYGIYYGMIGNADNMNAYVFQYDPGACNDTSKRYSAYDYKTTGGTMLVKKVIFEPNVYADTSGVSSKFKTNTAKSPGYQEKNNWGIASGSDSNYYALPFEEAQKYGSVTEVLRVPLYTSDETYKSGNTTYSNGASLQTQMNKYYTESGKSANFNPKDAHTIDIRVNMDTDGRFWHKIYVDDNPNPILKFVDHSTKSTKTGTVLAGDYIIDGKTRMFRGTYNGLRAWSQDNVKVTFLNENHKEDNNTQLVYKSRIWGKYN